MGHQQIYEISNIVVQARRDLWGQLAAEVSSGKPTGLAIYQHPVYLRLGMPLQHQLDGQLDSLLVDGVRDYVIRSWRDKHV